MGIGPAELLIIFLIIVLPLLLYVPIAKKAGYSAWWGLAMALPFLNIIIIWVFAFSKWPIEKDNKTNEVPIVDNNIVEKEI